MQGTVVRSQPESSACSELADSGDDSVCPLQSVEERRRRIGGGGTAGKSSRRVVVTARRDSASSRAEILATSAYPTPADDVAPFPCTCRGGREQRPITKFDTLGSSLASRIYTAVEPRCRHAAMSVRRSRRDMIVTIHTAADGVSCRTRETSVSLMPSLTVHV